MNSRNLLNTNINYYAFGSLMPGRSYSSSDYRYGFNGYEKDDEIKSSGNSYTTEFRQYDPRLARWLSPDPLASKYPWQSPYVAFNNNPIFFADPRGLEGDPPTEENDIGAPNIDVTSLNNTRHIEKNIAEGAFKDKDPSDPTYGFIKSGTGYEKIGFQETGEQGSKKGSFFAVKPQEVKTEGFVTTGFGTDVEFNSDGTIAAKTISAVETNVERLIASKGTSTDAPNGNEQRFPTSIQVRVPTMATKMEISNANKIAAGLQEKYNITVNVVVGNTGSATGGFFFLAPETVNTSITFKTFDFGF